MLKQPLQTSITVDNLDFEEFAVQEQLHIGISVKDFKAIVTHAESLKTSITALYTFPSRPMQISYHEHGMLCEFTLMTIGDYRGGSVTPAPAVVRQVPVVSSEKPSSHDSAAQAQSIKRKPTTMPPPAEPASRSFTREPQSQRTQRPSPPPPKASLDPESLFLPLDEDEDRLWGERSYDDDEDTLGWNASANNVCQDQLMCKPFTQNTRPQIRTTCGGLQKRLQDWSLILRGQKNRILVSLQRSGYLKYV